MWKRWVYVISEKLPKGSRSDEPKGGIRHTCHSLDTEYAIRMGSKEQKTETGQAQSDGTFEKMRQHVKEFVEATPEEHGK